MGKLIACERAEGLMRASPMSAFAPSASKTPTPPQRRWGEQAVRQVLRIFFSTGRMYSRNFAGCSLIGKWPTCFMIVHLDARDLRRRASVSSGVQEKSYSPVSR